jgi:tetratricopeptide (TPR) repeat protein
MKKLLFSLLAVALTFGIANAQDGEKTLKKGTRALSLYHMDPSNNASKLEEARELVEEALEDEAVSSAAGGWIARGEVYNALVGKEVNQLLTAMVTDGSDYELPDGIGQTAVEAYESFNKGLELSEKKAQKRDALNGLSETASYLNSIGNDYLQSGDFAKAYVPLNTVLELNALVTDNGGDPVLETADDVLNTQYVVAYCAVISGDDETAMSYFDGLVESGYPEPGVYASYVNLLMRKEGMEDKTEEILNKGKELFPDDNEILFAEINYYLRQNRLDELVGKLQAAIEAEPGNASLYSTLGNVYDNLFQRELEAGNPEVADEHFASALEYYNQAVEIKPDYPEAVYSIGALYYNKAAAVSKEMIELEDDYSREGIQKYEALKESMMGLFDEALPFFQQAEAMNPNDMNTLIALREIYARKDDIEKSNEFKARMDKITAGETIESSFFDN